LSSRSMPWRKKILFVSCRWQCPALAQLNAHRCRRCSGATCLTDRRHADRDPRGAKRGETYPRNHITPGRIVALRPRHRSTLRVEHRLSSAKRVVQWHSLIGRERNKKGKYNGFDACSSILLPATSHSTQLRRALIVIDYGHAHPSPIPRRKTGKRRPGPRALRLEVQIVCAE